MGYLDNSTITVDAILTKRGRELLAQGRGTTGGFNITRFALADDEVDYDLWNPAHPLGSDYYGAVIENMPITEAVPDETQSMKYKLITLPIGIRRIPYLQATKASFSLNPTNASAVGAGGRSFLALNQSTTARPAERISPPFVTHSLITAYAALAAASSTSMAQHLSPLKEVFYRTPSHSSNADNPQDRFGKLGEPVQNCERPFCGLKRGHHAPCVLVYMIDLLLYRTKSLVYLLMAYLFHYSPTKFGSRGNSTSGKPS